MTYLRRAVDLAAQALEAGEEPFGSVLVSAQGDVLFEDHNHASPATTRATPSSRSRAGRPST